ncbi:MAG TPA: ABC transporter ATP-binding protein [Actinomycetota bacterium]|nr:ABC transporter ATP-binding protein [Actinomycetota bacterium]
MLQLSDVWAAYRAGAPVLQGASLAVKEGEVVAILGRNGVGKTTLLRTIMGLVRVERGSIQWNGREISRLSTDIRARLGLGYAPQGREVFPALSTLENLKVAARGRRNEVDRTVEEVLEEFPMLRGKLAQRAGSLSGGEQQILAIARAFAARPRLLLLDEPSEGIQPSVVNEIERKVRDLNRKFGMSILLVEQNLDFAASLAQRAYVMHKGAIHKELEPSAILSDEELQHEYMGV